MRRPWWFAVSAALLLSPLLPGCGGGPSALQDGPGNAFIPGRMEKGFAIPPVGAVLTQRALDFHSLFAGLSRAVDTSLTLGKLSTTGGAATSATVPQNRINLYSAQISSYKHPLVWTVTPVANATGSIGDNDLAVYSNGVHGVSANVGVYEEWVAIDTPSPGPSTRYFGLVYGAPDGIASHLYRVEADLSGPLQVNGTGRTGLEQPYGSDWFHFTPLYDPASGSYPQITVSVTALDGTDPDLYLYDSANGNGSAPVAASDNTGDDSVSYTSSWGYRLYVRVQAFSGAPCKYTIAVSSP